MKQLTKRHLSALFVTACLPMTAAANECSSVRFAEVGWTDITATTALASEVLEALGYEPPCRYGLGAHCLRRHA